MNTELTKKQASVILYEMLVAQGEEDTVDVVAAGRLKDLYDCHRCVRAISQVYAKGIVPATEDEKIFGVNLSVSEEEMKLWKKRVCFPELRVPPRKLSPRQVRRLTEEAARQEIRESGGDALLIDLRDEQDGNRFLESIRIMKTTIQQLRLNPFEVSNDREQLIFLLGNSGGEGLLAADMLARFGFCNLVVIIPKGREKEV